MKTELNLYKRLKGFLCVTLSMVMFFGMTLGVQAEGKKYRLTCTVNNDTTYYFMDDSGESVADNAEIEAGDIIKILASGGKTVVVCINGSEKIRLKGYNDKKDYIVPSPPEKYTFTTSWNGSDTYTLNLLYDAPASTDSHTHSYSWQTISTVSENQDGEEIYVCSCGDIADRRVTSAMGQCFTNSTQKVIDAKSGDTVTLDVGLWNSFLKKMMEEIAKKRDIDIIIHLTYKGKNYEIKIPKNAEIDLSCDWYGPEKLAQMFGRTEIVK